MDESFVGDNIYRDDQSKNSENLYSKESLENKKSWNFTYEEEKNFGIN